MVKYDFGEVGGRPRGRRNRTGNPVYPYPDPYVISPLGKLKTKSKDDHERLSKLSLVVVTF